MLTVEDCKNWIQENQEDLDKDRLACSDDTVQMLNKMSPEISSKLWNTGCWISNMLKEHGATEEQISDIQFAHGQRCMNGNPFSTAVAYVNEFIENGDTKEKGGPELANKINKEIFG